MKLKILPIFSAAFVLSTLNVLAQKNKTYAITGEVKGSYIWNTVREIDLNTGEALQTIYDRNSETTIISDNLKVGADATMLPMAEGVAAAAFDARQNRLYYTTMRGTQLRYFDLNSPKPRAVYGQEKSLFEGNRLDEANVITRMAFASDGVGYAITNDGNHLIRFTTDARASIIDLGPLVDGKKNGGVSIHAQCSSWGGDMVGDAYGNLYLISYRNYIYRINPQTRVADLIGQVKGLPAQFTSNGMVVDDNGDLVVSSAILSDNYYKVNISTLEATALKSSKPVFNASDLANSNLLYQNNSVSAPTFRNVATGNGAVTIFPNPVTGKVFTMQFYRLPPGRYQLNVADVAGRTVLIRNINLGTAGQTEKVALPRQAAGGVYLLKIIGQKNTIVFSEKIVVE